MQVQTLSVVIGGNACNAKCPFCISAITPLVQNNVEAKEINLRNFHKAANLAKTAMATTVMLTSKGETTLYQEQIDKYLELLQEWNFPLIEMQTNGLLLGNKVSFDTLKRWYDLGLNTVAISIASYDAEINRKIFTPFDNQYMNLESLIYKLKDVGFVVRNNCILHQEGVHTVEHVSELISQAKSFGVDQLTLTPVNTQEKNNNSAEELWVKKHQLSSCEIMNIKSFLDTFGTIVYKISADATVYDVEGQNVSFSACLTKDNNTDFARNLIFYSSGKLVRSWEFPSTIILR